MINTKQELIQELKNNIHLPSIVSIIIGLVLIYTVDKSSVTGAEKALLMLCAALWFLVAFAWQDNQAKLNRIENMLKKDD